MFVLIYVLVVAGLYVTSRFWMPVLARLGTALGLAPSSATSVAPGAAGGPVTLVSPSFRPGAPRPPRLKSPPELASRDEAGLRGYGRRLAMCARIVGRIASNNPAGFPSGLFREWFEARWLAVAAACGADTEQSLGEALRLIPADDKDYDAVIVQFAAEAGYAEMADLVHFCGQAFVASRAGSPVHVAIVALADRLAVAEIFGDHADSPSDEHEQSLLERKLEVDSLGHDQAKVSHLRRMHAFFRQRLVALRDDPAAERRSERMADCRRHMDEHERLLSWLGSAV